MRAIVGMLLMMLLVTGCVSIRTEWEPISNVDWTTKTTFSFAPEASSEEDAGANAASSRELVRGLIRDDLSAKGYKEAEQQPDFLVYFFVGSGRHHTARYDRQVERMGEIDIHMGEAGASKWLWHGWASETLTRRLDREAEARKAVPLILAKFPRAS